MRLIRYSCGHISGPHKSINVKFGLVLFGLDVCLFVWVCAFVCWGMCGVCVFCFYSDDRELSFQSSLHLSIVLIFAKKDKFFPQGESLFNKVNYDRDKLTQQPSNNEHDDEAR